MESNKKYLIYDEENRFYSFYLKESPEIMISKHNNLNYIELSDEIYEFISQNDFSKVIINHELLTADNVNIITEKKYISIEENPAFFDMVLIALTDEIKKSCNKSINSGIYIELSNGIRSLFTYKLEDQLNLKSVISTIEDSKEFYYYKASGANYTRYTKEDLLKIYNELENYKNYNLIYTNVLCDWVINYYTQEMYNNGEHIHYGYSNDEIIKEVDEIYASQLLQ